MTRRTLLAHAWLQLGLWVAIAVVCNHLAAAVPLRLDMSGDQRHSLAAVSIDAVTHLESPLTATVWFTEGLEPPHHRHRQAVVDLLAELESYSHGQLDVVLRDPTGDPETIEAARAAGIRPITRAVRDATRAEARQVWMGVSFDHGDRHASVDALPAIDQIERDLVRGILSATTPTDARKTVGWSVGNGEPDLGRWPADHPMGELRVALAARHDLVRVDAAAGPIPEQVDALVIVGPQLPVGQAAQDALDAFVLRGGRIALFLSNHQPDFDTMRTRPVPHGLEPLLSRWGVQVRSGLLVDPRQNEAMVVPVNGALARVSYPLAPVSTSFARSESSVRGLQSAVLPFASPVDARSSDAVEATPWLATGLGAHEVAAPMSLEVEALANPPGTGAAHPVVVALAGRFASSEPGQTGAPTRMVVAGSADMVANNVELVLNSIDWLLDDTRLIAIRSRTTVAPPLRPSDRGGTLKLATAGVPSLVLLFLGGLVLVRRER